MLWIRAVLATVRVVFLELLFIISNPFYADQRERESKQERRNKHCLLLCYINCYLCVESVV